MLALFVVHLALRERSLDRAALAAGTLLAAACMTHPYGVFSLVGVGVFLAVLDARRLRPRHSSLRWAGCAFIMRYRLAAVFACSLLMAVLLMVDLPWLHVVLSPDYLPLLK